MKRIWIGMKKLLLTGVALTLAACSIDLPQQAPKMILADDGDVILACEGLVWVSPEAGSYKITYTGENHLQVTLRGVKKVTVSDIPAMVDAPMPYPLPDLPGTYSNGQPWRDGDEIDWPNGNKARLQGGKLVPVKVPSNYCKRL